MTAMEFTVPGTPVPQGSKRVVSSRGRSGRAWVIDTNDSTLRPWRATVAAAAMAAILARVHAARRLPVAAARERHPANRQVCPQCRLGVVGPMAEHLCGAP